MARGGRRPGAGRPKKLPKLKVRRDVAFEVLEIINGQKPRAKASGEAELILKLMEAKDERLRWDIYRYNKECVDGKPVQRQEETVIFDPNQPLRVVIEHIGRPQDKAPTQAK